MDIINNAYLDMNEKGMYEDRYFALSNYDNIYDTTNNNNNNSSMNSNLTQEQDNPTYKVITQTTVGYGGIEEQKYNKYGLNQYL